MLDFLGKIAPRFPSRLAKAAPAPFGEWKSLAARGLSPFDAAFAGVSPLVAPYVGGLPEIGESLSEQYLPIEALRDEEVGAKLFGTKPIARAFRSSGTTRADRSIARFSAEGLECYRVTSLYTFLSVLADVSGNDPLEMTGISLVPPVSEWPESSLAQMVAWIGEVVPLHYATETTFASVLETHDSQPLWVFGTAFHFVHLMEQGRRVTLPRGSIVFETGGTKGKSRAVTRAELYAGIEEHLRVPSTSIVSEYGMCELAAQAYDFVAAGSAESRRFRFPAWVRPRALTAPGIAQARGTGALLVDDPMRLDAPWPIRTEDIVTLEGLKSENTDGVPSFQLLGRIPGAPLKGCSLAAESVMGPVAGVSRSSSVASAATVAHAKKTQDAPQSFRARAAAVKNICDDLIDSPLLLAALMHEFGSARAARSALNDVRRGMPDHEEAWLDAAKVATNHGQAPLRWLFILPENHSLVGFYPLAIAMIAGLDVCIRMPRRFATTEGASQSALTLMIDKLAKMPGARLDVRDASWRIQTADDVASFDAILAYGTEETLRTLAEISRRPVQGFGPRFTVSIINGETLREEAPRLAKDAWGLAQTGCMSTRLAIVREPDAPSYARLAEIGAEIAIAGRVFWQAPIPETNQIALDLESWRYRQAGFMVPTSVKDEPLIALKSIALKDEEWVASLTQWLAARPFALPVLVCDESDSQPFVKKLIERLSTLPTLGTITLSPIFMSALTRDPLVKSDYEGLSFRGLGEANAPPWTGRHEHIPLFMPRRS